MIRIREKWCTKCSARFFDLAGVHLHDTFYRGLLLSNYGVEFSLKPANLCFKHRSEILGDVMVKLEKRDKYYQKTYGIGFKEYFKMINSQGRQCAACRKEIDWNGKKQGHVDHDHVTGNVRGILCRTCNTGLGMIGDGRAQHLFEYIVS